MLHSNAILASLSASDSAALRPHLKATHIQQKTVLYETGDTIKAEGDIMPVFCPTGQCVSASPWP